MIISASYRTDIPALYGQWFAQRLRAGFCEVANPYGGGISRVALDPDHVAGLVFWTRNAAPFMPVLEQLAAEGRPFVIQFTVTGYPRIFDAGTLASTEAAAQIRHLADRFGSRAVVWRLDPLVFSDLTPPHWHMDNFQRLAQSLAGAVDEVVLSVVQPYRKTRRNMDRRTADAGVTWWDPPASDKLALLAGLAERAVTHGLRATLCAQPELADAGVPAAVCIDPVRLSAVAGREIVASGRGHRKECGCAPSRDIGAYDGCPQGCAYCYAVGDRERAKRRLAAHDPSAPLLT